MRVLVAIGVIAIIVIALGFYTLDDSDDEVPRTAVFRIGGEIETTSPPITTLPPTTTPPTTPPSTTIAPTTLPPTTLLPATDSPPSEHYPETPRLTRPPTNLQPNIPSPTTAPPTANVFLMKIVLPLLISTIFLVLLLNKQQSFPLSLNKWYFFAISGAIFFLAAGFLTGKLEPMEQFVEIVVISKIVLDLFGARGLYIKVLVPFLLLVIAKIKYPHGKLLHIHFTRTLKFHIIDLDIFVIIWFFMGLFDFINDYLLYQTII